VHLPAGVHAALFAAASHRLEITYRPLGLGTASQELAPIATRGAELFVLGVGW
jgi:hypothetical protein